MKIYEESIKKIAKQHLQSARAGDWEHALRVVHWVKELGGGRSDLNLLITAAYIHDIGWSGVAPVGKIDLDEMLRLEHKANSNSSLLINKVLKDLQFTDSDIATVTRLVKAADCHLSETDDEAIIVDADNLSKLCIEHLEEKYKPESFVKLIEMWETKLADRIRTEKGKALFPELLANLKEKVK